VATEESSAATSAALDALAAAEKSKQALQLELLNNSADLGDLSGLAEQRLKALEAAEARADSLAADLTLERSRLAELSNANDCLGSELERERAQQVAAEVTATRLQAETAAERARLLQELEASAEELRVMRTHMASLEAGDKPSGEALLEQARGKCW
jgi:hypothetical protein